MFGNLLKSQCVNHYDVSQAMAELNYIHKLWELDNELQVCTEQDDSSNMILTYTLEMTF
jgi:hypothetical protein